MNVIVIGLGAMGSAVAQHLAQRGCTVRGFDQFSPPHSHGSSHGLSRIFRQAYFEDHRYVPLLMRSFELWQRLERDSGERLIFLPGSLVLGPSDGELVKRSAESAQTFGLPHEVLCAAEVKRRYPIFAVKPETLGLLEHNAGYLLPEACITQQLRQAVRAGALLHPNDGVLDWHAEANGAGVRVLTASGTYRADHLVITAGPWAPQLLSSLGLPLRVTRQVLCWFEPKDSLEHFRQERLPVYLIEADGEMPLLYGFPLTGDECEGVKVALHGSEEDCTPQSCDRKILASDEQRIRARLAGTLPGLAGRLLRAETCLYTMTPDEHFLLGPHPSFPAVSVAAGFSGHGFKFAQAIGELLAAAVIDAKPSSIPDLFSMHRFGRSSQAALSGD
jgi:sarcosine oxidase